MTLLERPWGVSAYGAGSVRAKPDVVRVKFTVGRTEQTPAEAFAATSAAVQAVRQVARDHGVPDSAVERSQLGLQSEWSYHSERKFVGYKCTARFVIESPDLDGVQPLLVDLVGAGVNEIDEVDFDVASKVELRAQARQEAVAAARRKAELYAEAAGVRLGAVVHIEEVDPRVVITKFASRSTSLGGGGAPSSADLAPGRIVVQEAVVLGFGIVPAE
jgi:uncharacterized protein